MRTGHRHAQPALGHGGSVCDGRHCDHCAALTGKLGRMFLDYTMKFLSLQMFPNIETFDLDILMVFYFFSRVLA